MNHKKTKIFGLDHNRDDIDIELPVIQHTSEGTSFTQVKSQSASKHIRNLGLWMNMHLDWSRAVSEISKSVGWYKHLIRGNDLSTEAASYLISAV